nr:transposase family protein [Streptomyces canus]
MRRRIGVPATKRTGAAATAPTVTASRTAWTLTTFSIRIAPVCPTEETRPPLSRNVCQNPVKTYTATPTQQTVNRALSAARAPVERGVARLKSWRIFRRARSRPNRMSSIAAAILTLERQR